VTAVKEVLMKKENKVSCKYSACEEIGNIKHEKLGVYDF
jgi:hypothetical protein